MLKIESVDIKEFRKDIYPMYKEIFPKSERRPLINLKRTFKSGYTKIMKIINNSTFIGFAIIEVLPDSKYVWLDYFTIFDKYQNKGYGTNVIKLLKEQFKEYIGIFVEIEKEGIGENVQENELRERRANFYKKLGFIKLSYDVELYKVIYTPYILKTSNVKVREDIIYDEIFNIYTKFTGEEFVNKYCKVLKNDF